MKRRTFAALVPVLFAGGCGFELRRAPTFAFQKIYLNAPAASPIARDLKKAIASGGTVTVVADPLAADVVLDVLAEQRQKVVVGLSAVGQVTEFELRMRFRFRLRTPQGRELIPDAEIAQQRDISFTESAALAKESEEQLLYRDMQADIVLQTMRRLAAAKIA
ncbi:MAG TPA: LPS assembly lipoprotein LptE [Ramlibacter sp.]|nr:LPS assembly lipoprotein LptE [Ramlibacter sp.]